MNSELAQWVLIPLLIMVARITDVTIGTIRIIFVARGNARVAAILGFFEVTIWLLAISQVLQNLTNVACYLGYGLGFALGNVFGITVEKRLCSGMQIIRIVTTSGLGSLPMVLRDEGYGVTTVKGQGAKGPVDLVYVVAERKNTAEVLELVESMEPASFVTVQDIGHHQHGHIKTIRRLAGLLGK